MIVLDLVSVGWFSRDIDVLNNGSLLAKLQFSSWKEDGSISIGDLSYLVRKDGMFGNRFMFEKNGESLCLAVMEGFWTRTVVLNYGHVRYALKSSGSGRKVNIFRDESEVGSVYGKGFFGRNAKAEFLEELPSPIPIFMLWLTVLGWNRDANAAAG